MEIHLKESEQTLTHICSTLIHHLFPLLVGIVTVDGVRGRGHLFLWFVSPQVENGQFSTADIQVVLHFDPAGEVL